MPVITDEQIDTFADWRTLATKWQGEAEQFLAYGNKALELGQPSTAYDIYSEGLALNENHLELMYRTGLALARCRSTSSAALVIKKLLTLLPEGSKIIADAYSLSGRLAKDQWQMATDPNTKAHYAQRSMQAYQRAYDISNSYYPAINAASMAVICGDIGYSQSLAKSIQQQHLTLSPNTIGNDYWLAATLGEACLLLNEQSAAKQWYQQALHAINGNFGNQAAIYRQAKMLSEFIPVNAELLSSLSIPNVVVFTGHMIDSPQRPKPRFTQAMEAQVKTAISAALVQTNAQFAVCSAACGADIIFIEAMLEKGGDVHIILPFKQDDFIATSVDFAGGDWLKRFHKVLGKARQVSYATQEGYLNDDALFEYANSLMAGSAILQANILETEVILLAAVEPKQAITTGGAWQLIEQWQQLQRPSHIIDISQFQTATPKNSTAAAATNTAIKTQQNIVSRHVKTMVFADVVGFSALGEAEAPSFFVHFLNKISETIKQQPVQPSFVNTWGDGLFLVYDDIETAAHAALSLRDAVISHNWLEQGLPENTSIRIGMHTGPVYAAVDPIINAQNFYGSHVNRAARIEPVAIPGSVFISEQTAGLLAFGHNTDFHCDYLGEMNLAKKYGSSVLYRLRRIEELE